MSIIVFKLINIQDESEVASFVSKAGMTRTYKEIILTTWKRSSLNNSFTEVHKKMSTGALSKKIVGVTCKKNAWIDTGMLNTRIDVYQDVDGKPNLLNDTDLSTFLTLCAVPLGVTPVIKSPVKKMVTKSPGLKLAIAAKKKTKLKSTK